MRGPPARRCDVTSEANRMASPLHWPIGRPRTAPHLRRRNANWKSTTVAAASDEIVREVRLMGGGGLVLSTNLALRADGFPRSVQPEPADPGVAVYFTRKGQKLALACDAWKTVAQNLRAIGMHLAALRGQERWRVGSLDQAFAGYAALPEPNTSSSREWWQVLTLDLGGLNQLKASGPLVQRAWLRDIYRELAKERHPDAGGTDAAFRELTLAVEQAKEALGLAGGGA